MNKKELMSDNLKKKFQVEIILNKESNVHASLIHTLYS